MNMQSETLRHSAASVSVAPEISSVQRLDWSIRRELWENRSLYLVPAAAAGIVVFGFLISLFHLPQRTRAALALDAARQHNAISTHYDVAAGVLMAVIMIVGAFYCLDALYGERRDRSILFWKSMPVSDVTTVLAKFAVPLLVLPLVAFGLTFVVHAFMLLLSVAVLSGNGIDVATYWNQLGFFRMEVLLLYHLFTVHSIWPAPIFAYLLMVSAWARRAPILWATLPIVAVYTVEKLAFNTTYFVSFLAGRITGSGTEAIVAPGTMPMNPMTHLTPMSYILTPELWGGLAVAAAFLAGAVYLRRKRGPELS